MRHTKHVTSLTRLYGLLCVPLLLLAQAQAQTAQTAQTAVTDQDVDEVAQIHVVSTAYTLTFSVDDEDKDKYIIENVTCPNGSGPIALADDNYVCENLEPCTKYTIIVSLKGTAEESLPFEQIVIVYTDYKEPQTNLTSVVPTANSIQVTWETSDRACVKNFEISVITPGDTKQRQIFKDQSTETIQGVSPCLTYNVTLNTTNNASVVVDTDSRLVDTFYLDPGDLQITMSNNSNSETVLKWDVTENQSCVSSYTIVWRRDDCVPNDTGEEETTTTEMDDETTTIEDDDDATTDLDDFTGMTTWTEKQNEPKVECEWSEEIISSSTREFAVKDLQGCALHTFDVYINMNRNATPKGTGLFYSGIKIPSAVSEPNPNISFAELKWSWSPPSDHAECVANYNVTLTGPTQRVQYSGTTKLTKETFYIFDHLEPCGMYDVEIVPITHNGSFGATFKSECKLHEDQPTQILDPISSTGPFNITLSWQTPSYADLCIKGYRICGWMDEDNVVESMSVDTVNTSVQFDKDIFACQAYTIQIIPYTEEKLDGELRKMDVETQAAKVNVDKIQLQLAGKKATSHSLELNAQNKDFNNNCQTIFALFNCSTAANVPNAYAEMYVESYRDRGFQATIAPLSPNTQYICNVLLYNVAGESAAQKLTGTDLITLVYFPEQPTNVRLNTSTPHSLEFKWDPPKLSNGAIKVYQAFLMRYEADYFVHEGCEAIITNPATITKDELFNVFHELQPAVKYIMQVAAQNDFGLGQYTAPIIGITQPDVSDPVTDLNVTSEGPALDPASYKANVTVYWTVPCKSNGEIEHFSVQFSYKGQTETISPIEVPLDKQSKKGRMSYTKTDLQPELEYAVTVAVKTRNVARMSEMAKREWTSPSGLPSGLSDDVVRQMRVSAYETNHPTSSAIVRLPANILNSESGNITYIALLLSQKSCTGKPELKYDLLNSGDWPSVPSWDEVRGDCIQQYQTTPVRWKPLVNGRSSRDVNIEDEIVFTIGVGKCPDISERYCNGPLTANMEYNMVVRLFTNSGYSDTAVLEFKTEAAIKVTLILVSVCSCLLLAFILGLVVLYVRKRIAWHRDSGQGIEDPFGNVIAKNFAIFYAEVAKPEKLAREFKEITVVALELSYSASELGNNKNRYADIYPYDKNRVILDIDTEGSDYINASFIDGHTRKKEYIATQGPKPESVMDFWRMILQHNVRVIVQVTQFREGNTIKCHEYYPYNTRGVIVTIKSKESFEIYDRTELSVVNEKYGLKEKVIHFYFKKWPDHGCPDDPNHLITFVKKVKAERRPNYSPIVVHCSAGVGRTGTFIGLDLIMQRLKSESKINIFETVKKLRFQRMKMVQTQQQYTFLYACTFELVKHKIPRAALKPNGRKKTDSVPSAKKVSFPDTDLSRVEEAVQDTPDPERGGENNILSRFGGLRRTKDLDSLCEQPEGNSFGRPNKECAI